MMEIRCMSERSGVKGLRVGEIIRIKTRWGLPPDGVYEVQVIFEGYLLICCGDVQLSAYIEEIEVVERGMGPTIDWLGSEIEVLTGMLTMCSCAECVAKLEQKRAQRGR